MLTQKQENRYIAYTALYQVLLTDRRIYEHDLALCDLFARLQTAVKGIADALKNSGGEKSTTGITKSKAAARAALITATTEIAGDLYAYATKCKSAVLQAESQVSKSSLRDLSDVRLISLVSLIRERLTEHAAPLVAYAVTEARLKEFDDAFARFDRLRTGPRQRIGQNAAIRAVIAGHFRTLATLLKDELLPVMRKYERQAPGFFTHVVSAREVIDQPATRSRTPSPKNRRQPPPKPHPASPDPPAAETPTEPPAAPAPDPAPES